MNRAHVSRNVMAALPVAFLLPFAGAFAAGLTGISSSPRVSTSIVFAGLATAFLAMFVALRRRRLPRAGVLAACHALAWAPFVAIGAWQATEQAIVQGNVRGCGTGLMALVIFVVPAGGLALLLGGIAVGAGFAHRGTDRALRTIAVGATALAWIAFLFAAPRMTRPDPDTYLASLPAAGQLRADADMQILGRTLRYQRVAVADSFPSATGERGEPLLPRVECHLEGLGEPETFYPGFHACPTLRIRIDPGHDLAVIDSPPYPESGIGAIAFRPSTGERLTVSAVTVADRIGPPIGWTIGAALGGLAGLGFLFAASRMRRRAAALEGVSGKHLGDGLVELPNGDRLRVDAAVDLPAGDVVLRERNEQLPTYRIMGVPTFAIAWPGTLAAARTARTDLAASLDALAIAAATLGATPLVVARVLGVF